MMTPIDAVRCDLGFSESAHWRSAQVRFLPAERTEDDPHALARGVVWGAALSAVLWVGLIAVARVAIHFFAHL